MKEEKKPAISSAYGLGKRNQRNERFVEFCKDQNSISNTDTMFSQL